MAASYVAAMLLYIYGIANPSTFVGNDTANRAVFIVLAVLHSAVGWLANRWWALLLPVVVVLAAIPAGEPEKGWEPYPIWFGIAVGVPLAMLLILAGILAHRVARPQAAA